MLAAQEGACAICRETPSPGTYLSVDHNHANGEIRGLLCRQCNFALGAFKDSPFLLVRAFAYLERHSAWKVIDVSIAIKAFRKIKQKVKLTR